jgi:hypothetical protein
LKSLILATGLYGLLGIQCTDNHPNEGKLFLEPDYSISDSELWRKMASKVIRQSGSLSLLSSVQYSTEGYEMEGGFGFFSFDDRPPKEPIPSWVPHWEIVYRATLAPWDASDRFNAAKDFNLNLRDNKNNNILEVEGIKVGVVGYTLKYLWHELDTSILWLNDLGAFFKSEPGLRILAKTLSAGRNWYGSLAGDNKECLADLAAYLLDYFEKIKEKLRMSTVSHVLSDEELENHESGHPYDPITKELTTAQSELAPFIETLAANGDAGRFQETAIPLCERRRLFLTINGFLGLAPDNVEEGGIICVLSGGDLPFLLRPYRPYRPQTSDENDDSFQPQSSQGVEENHYLLVGECYVQNLMQGEAFQALNYDKRFTGQVPTDLIVQEIITRANQPEPFSENDFKTVGELNRLRNKKTKLDSGWRARKEDFEEATRTQLKKRWFEIR